MKKVLYSVLALAGLLTLSCAKEIDAPNAEFAQENLVPLTLTASYDVATKVTYEGLKTFGWEANDSIKVRVVSGDNKKSGWYALGAKAAGATAQFVGDVPDTYTPRDYAFYPGFKQNSAGGTSSAPSVRLPITYYLDEVDASSNPIAPHIDPSNCTKVYVSSSNPLQFLPSVGSLQEGGSFKFQAAYGVLNIQMTDLDDAACGLRLVGTADAYMGNYLMLDKTDLCYKIGAKYVSPSSGSTLSTTYIQYWFYPKADHTASIYLPVPVGTLPAGCYINIVDEKGTVLYTQTFAKDVEVQRGKITTLAPFKAKYDWTSVGTGKYIDAYLWESFGFTDPVDVKIETSGNGHYRVENPYGVAAQTYKYEIPSTATGPDDYLNFSVVPVGSSLYSVTTTKKGLVDFNDYYTGLVSSSYGVDPYIAHPGGWSSLRNESNFAHNIVTKFAADGETPAVVQLAPVYFWLTDPSAGRGYSTASDGWTGGGSKGPSYAKNNLIQILFPGEESLLDINAIVKYVEISDPTPAQAVAKVNVTVGKDVASVQMVIAASAADAAEAFAAGTHVATATATGDVEVKLPANAPTGEYHIYSIVTVATGLNPDCGGTLVSDAFLYNNADDLTLLGNAKYMDTFINGSFNFASAFTEVEVYSDATDATHYRLVNPYPVIAAANSYTIPEGITADPYLDLYVKADGSVEYALGYTTINTGLDAATAFSSATGNLLMVYPDFFTGTTVDRNLVVKYDAEGKPAVLQLDPIFTNTEHTFWSWYAGGTKEANNIIQILFPGQAESYDLTAAVIAGDINTDDVNNMYITAGVMLGADLASATVVMAASATAAETAIAGGEGVVVTTTGYVNIPIAATTPSGKYSLYAKTTVAEGLNPKAGQLLATEEFNFFNPGDDKGYTIEDICGDWNAANGQIYNSGWAKKAIKMTIAANTEDPTLGDVMITSFYPEYFSGSKWSQVGSLYAWFDTKTGLLSVDVPQGAWVHSNYPEEVVGILNYTTSLQSSPITFVLEDKSTLNLSSDTIIMIGSWDSKWAYAGTWTYLRNLNFTKVVATSVSAAAPRVNAQFPSKKVGKVSFSASAPGAKMSEAER